MQILRLKSHYLVVVLRPGPFQAPVVCKVRPNSSKLLSGSSYRDVTGTDEQTPSPLCMSGQPRDGDQEGSQSGRRRAALEGGRCGPARTQHTQALLTAHGLDVCARALQRLKDVAFRQCPRCKTRIAV